MDAETGLKISAAAFSITTANIALGLAGYSARPLTGYQYTQAGGEHLDKALDILHGPRGANIEDHLMRDYLNASEALVTWRDDLDEKTNSCIGSIVHWNKAKDFCSEADTLRKTAVSSSSQANNKKALHDLKMREAVQQRTAWERDEEQLQALARRRQLEDTVPMTTISPPFNSPAHSSDPAPGPSSSRCDRFPNPLSQVPAYPPVAYQSSNSKRC